ncbi:MAG: transcriptional regulator, partial [Mesorhizobium sp.]
DRNLAGLLSQIRSWAEEHAPDIKEARARASVDHQDDETAMLP